MVVMDTLETLIQTVQIVDNMRATLPRAIEVLLHLLACNESVMVMEHLFATQRSIVVKVMSSVCTCTCVYIRTCGSVFTCSLYACMYPHVCMYTVSTGTVGIPLPPKCRIPTARCSSILCFTKSTSLCKRVLVTCKLKQENHHGST